ncbi:MAG TPA: ATP-binding protein [Verrucomicrobiae bacterium]
MSEVRVTPGRRFLVHGVLVLLPLVLLTAMAVLWLRQDRLTVLESAREVAKLSSKESVRRIQERLVHLSEPGRSNEVKERIEFTLTEDGRLLSPEPRDRLPVPRPYPITSLNADLRKLWEQAMEAEAGDTMTVRSNAWGAFLAKAPVEEWRALAQYHLALTLVEQKPEEASGLLKEVFMKPVRVQLESGLPLVPIAQWRWMQMNSNLVTGEMVDLFCSNAVAYPSVLTPDLVAGTLQFKQAVPTRVTHWMREWRRDEVVRKIHASYPNLWVSKDTEGQGREAKWVEAEWDNWFLLQRKEGGKVVGISWKTIQKQLREEMAFSYVTARSMVYQVKVADKVLLDAFLDSEISERHRINMPAETEVLAISATTEKGLAVEVTTYLWKHTAYQAKQDQRIWTLGGVIALAVVAALVGLISAWRTFQQQWQLSEMKSNFVSSVSHELRAPLASVRLMAESLERGKVPGEEKRQEYFQLIGRECRRLTALIENVLDFARMDQGRKQYQMEPTDVVMLMQHTVKGMEAYAAERKVTLKLAIEGEVPEMEMDGQAMQQAMINLIDNAVKYSPENKEVRVSMEFDGKFLCVGVRDEGPGIPRWERERIFERFYRSGQELRRETQGVGIGLSIVKHVVEAHEGSVTVAETKSPGSFFVIVLPMKKGKLTTDEHR